MKRGARTLLLAVLAAFLVLMGGASESESLEQLRKDARTYHKQFMDHVEASLAKLNASLYDWRDQGRPHSHLGALASHSVEVLTNLEGLVSSEMSGAQRRRLNQIYDDASRQAAEERLAGVTAEAEARYTEAVQLLQAAAVSAIQNNTEDLMAKLADKLKTNGVITGGKAISDQLQALQLADQVAENIRGLVPEFDGGASKGLGDVLSGGLSGLGGGLGNLFGGSLLDRFRKDRGAAPAPEMPVPAPEVQAGLNTELANEDDILFVSTENVDGVPIGETVPVSSTVSVTPLQRGSDADASPGVDQEFSRDEFYKERNEVFDRFDEEADQSAQPNIQRRALQSAGMSSLDTDAIIKSVESSLDALRSMRDRRIAVSKETAESIKARAADARERLRDMAAGASHSFAPGRQLRNADDAVEESKNATESGFLIFPGEPLKSHEDRITSADDVVIDDDVAEEIVSEKAPTEEVVSVNAPTEEVVYDNAPAEEQAPFEKVPPGEMHTSIPAVELSPTPSDVDETVIVMPMMPMIMSQEINFVFIPMDAEDLIKSVAEVLMSTMAEASLPIPAREYGSNGIDLGLFDAYDPSYELADGAVLPGFGPVQVDSSSSYFEPFSASQRRRRLRSTFDSMSNLLEDSNDLEIYFYDPIWFNSASQLAMLDADDGDDIAELSLAIRLGGPEDMGGLPPDVLLFLAESEAIMDAMMSSMMVPSYSVFDASASQAKAQADNENLADSIVQKLQSAYGPYGAYGQPAKAQGLYSSDPRGYSTSSDFDLKWLGVMFGAVGIVLIIAIGAITAFQSRAPTPPGYVVIEDIRAVQPQQQEAPRKSIRKTSNLPA